MSSYFLFLILGLGSGATYAILGQGLVLKYRSAGVVDFAHGAVAMFIAYVFINLRGFGQLELPVVLIPHQISLNGGAGLSTSLAIVINATTGLRRLIRRARRANLRGLPTDSRYSTTTSVASSSSQYCRRALLLTSARRPTETNVDTPSLRRTA